MKTKVKRLSKRTLAVFLGVLMLITSIGIGSLITADAWTWDSMSGAKIWITSDYYGNYEDKNGGTYDASWSNDYTYKFLYLKADYTYYFNCIISFNDGTTTTYGKLSGSDHYFGGSESSYDEPASGNSMANFRLNTITSDTGYVKVEIRMYKQYSSKASVRVYQTAATDKYVYGIPQGSGSWNTGTTSTLTKDTNTGNFYYDVTGTTNTVYFRIKFGFHYYYAGNSDVSLADSSDKKTANDNGENEPSKGAFKFTPSSSTKTYRVWIDVSGINVNFGGTLKVWYEELGDHYYLTGWLNGASETGNTHAFTNTSGTTWTYSFTPSRDEGGYQYMTIKKSDGTVYHPASHKSGSGTAGTNTDTVADGDNKWMVTATSGQTVNLTWDSSTHVLSWTVSGGGSSGTLTNYKVLYGTGNNITQLAVLSGAKVYDTGNDTYTVNFSEFLGNTLSKSGEYYIAISTSSDYTDILGGGPNSTGTCEVKDGNTFFVTAQMQQNNASNNNRYNYSHIKLLNNPNGLKYVVTLSGHNVKYDYYASGTAYNDGTGGGETASTVDVYAKSGTLRDGNETMGSYATSKIYKQDGTTEYAATDYLSGQNWKGGNCKSVAVKKGEIITVKTTIAPAQRSNFYVKGFDVNGVTYGLIKDESSITSTTKEAGEYSTRIEIDADTEEEKIEITPILYKFGEARTRFYIEGYDNVPSTEGWGATLFVYPFYGNLDGPDNSFKAYPGQAVINDGGKRYIDIPDKVGSTDIKGVTMSNGYWDTVHRAIEGWPNDNSAYHKQTYDYDDFYKIKREVPANKTLKDIIFYFKYKDGYKGSRTTEQDAGGNTAPASFTDVTTSTWKNDWEPLTDYYGRYVDVFGKVIEPQPSKSTAGESDTIHVVSNGYVNNNAGYFGTEWSIYTKSSSTYTRQTQISPSALLMKDSSSFDKYSGTKWPTYKTAYTKLDENTYKNKPVVITYENALYGGKKPNNSYDKAVRNDGRWYATYNEDTINAKIKIQKIGGGDEDWTDDTFKNTNEGTVTGAKAYFTNTSVTTLNGNKSLDNQVTATDVLQSNTGDFTFEADNSALSASYKFVGWFRQTATGDISSISKNISASSSMSANDTYIARYRYTGTATVKINHTLFPGSALGKTYVSAVVTHADGAQSPTTPYSETSGTLTIPMKSDDKKITVTLKSSSTGDNEFRGFYTGTDSGDLIAGTDTGVKETNKTQTIEILKSDIFNSNDTPKKETFNYYSKFDDVTETISVVYTYKDRFGADKKYRAERVLDANYLEAYSTSDTGDNRRYALNTKTIISDPSTKAGSYTIKEWIMDFAPKVDDLDKTSTWNLDSISHTDGSNNYTLNANQVAKTHKVKFKFKKNGNDFTSSVFTVADDAFTKTKANGGLMGYDYNDASSDFKYWAVWSAKRDGVELVKAGEKEYARCYNRFFSLTIPEDSYIEAVYKYKEGESNGNIAGIREPVFTREISNANENGAYIKDSDGKVVTTDVVYADFVVSYMTENYGVKLNSAPDKNNYKTGVIMEFNQNVSIDDNIASTITNKKFDSNLETIKSKLDTYLNGGDFGSGKNYTNYTAPTNGTYSSTGKNALYYYSIDNTKYNDLNRYDYFLKFNNTNTWRKRVMKAYYYVKNTITGDITLSDPVYFAINVIGNSEATVIGTTS